ncbi:hypothetical protein CHUAL_000410 [Chamberlinius hualienensis]
MGDYLILNHKLEVKDNLKCERRMISVLLSVEIAPLALKMIDFYEIRRQTFELDSARRDILGNNLNLKGNKSGCEFGMSKLDLTGNSVCRFTSVHDDDDDGKSMKRKEGISFPILKSVVYVSVTSLVFFNGTNHNMCTLDLNQERERERKEEPAQSQNRNKEIVYDIGLESS